MKFLITGATGNVGGELVTQMIDGDHQVRAYVRDPEKARRQLPAEAELAVGDLDDTAALNAAAQGVDGIFFMQTHPLPAQAQYLVDAAKSAGVRRIVVLSSIGTAVHPRPIIGAAISARDDVLRASGLEVTYLKPNTLASNALWWKNTITTEGKVYDPTHPGLTSPIDPYDLARVAVAVLTQPGHEGNSYILNGPEALSAREQIEILADVLGREIEFVPVTPEQYFEVNISRGTPEPQALALKDLQELFRVGRSGIVTEDVQNLTGVEPRTFRQWAEEHRADFN